MWRIFYFDASKYCGVVKSPEEWYHVVSLYDGKLALLKTARENTKMTEKSGIPSFGFFLGFDGRTTLGEWATWSNIQL